MSREIKRLGFNKYKIEGIIFPETAKRGSRKKRPKNLPESFQDSHPWPVAWGGEEVKKARWFSHKKFNGGVMKQAESIGIKLSRLANYYGSDIKITTEVTIERYENQKILKAATYKYFGQFSGQAPRPLLEFVIKQEFTEKQLLAFHDGVLFSESDSIIKYRYKNETVEINISEVIKKSKVDNLTIFGSQEEKMILVGILEEGHLWQSQASSSTEIKPIKPKPQKSKEATQTSTSNVSKWKKEIEKTSLPGEEKISDGIRGINAKSKSKQRGAINSQILYDIGKIPEATLKGVTNLSKLTLKGLIHLIPKTPADFFLEFIFFVIDIMDAYEKQKMIEKELKQLYKSMDEKIDYPMLERMILSDLGGNQYNFYFLNIHLIIYQIKINANPTGIVSSPFRTFSQEPPSVKILNEDVWISTIKRISFIRKTSKYHNWETEFDRGSNFIPNDLYSLEEIVNNKNTDHFNSLYSLKIIKYEFTYPFGPISTPFDLLYPENTSREDNFGSSIYYLIERLYNNNEFTFDLDLMHYDNYVNDLLNDYVFNIDEAFDFFANHNNRSGQSIYKFISSTNNKNPYLYQLLVTKYFFEHSLKLLCKYEGKVNNILLTEQIAIKKRAYDVCGHAIKKMNLIVGNIFSYEIPSAAETITFSTEDFFNYRNALNDIKKEIKKLDNLIVSIKNQSLTAFIYSAGTYPTTYHNRFFDSVEKMKFHEKVPNVPIYPNDL